MHPKPLVSDYVMEATIKELNKSSNPCVRVKVAEIMNCIRSHVSDMTPLLGVAPPLKLTFTECLPGKSHITTHAGKLPINDTGDLRFKLVYRIAESKQLLGDETYQLFLEIGGTFIGFRHRPREHGCVREFPRGEECVLDFPIVKVAEGLCNLKAQLDYYAESLGLYKDAEYKRAENILAQIKNITPSTT